MMTSINSSLYLMNNNPAYPNEMPETAGVVHEIKIKGCVRILNKLLIFITNTWFK